MVATSRRWDDVWEVFVGQAIIGATTANGGGIFIFLVLALLFYVLSALPVWGTFQKASPQGEPAWAAFVPIYNFIVLLRIAGRPKTWAWFLLLLLIPTVGGIALFVIWIIVLNDVSKSFGHGGGFTVGLVLLPDRLLVHPVAGREHLPGAAGPCRPGRRRYPTRATRPGRLSPPGYPQPGYPQQGGLSPAAASPRGRVSPASTPARWRLPAAASPREFPATAPAGQHCLSTATPADGTAALGRAAP